MGLILLIIIIILVVGGWPSLGLHSYGYGPSGVLGIILLVLLLLFIFGRL